MVSQGTVYNLRQRPFMGELPESVLKKSRLGRPVMKMTSDVEAHLVGLVCSLERFVPAEARRFAERTEWHYTPGHGSWLNIAEFEAQMTTSFKPAVA